MGRTRRLESPFFADATEGRLREGERGSGVKAGLWYGGGDGWKPTLVRCEASRSSEVKDLGHLEPCSG